jgi:hypothetical protein
MKHKLLRQRYDEHIFYIILKDEKYIDVFDDIDNIFKYNTILCRKYILNESAGTIFKVYLKIIYYNNYMNNNNNISFNELYNVIKQIMEKYKEYISYGVINSIIYKYNEKYYEDIHILDYCDIEYYKKILDIKLKNNDYHLIKKIMGYYGDFDIKHIIHNYNNNKLIKPCNCKFCMI